MGDWQSFIKPLVIAFLIFLLIYLSSNFEALVAAPPKLTWMQPTLGAKDILWFCRENPSVEDLERGMLVVYRPPESANAADDEQPLISRVIALPGDAVRMTPEETYVIHPGQSIEDATPLVEAYAGNHADADYTELIWIPDGYVYVLNDGRTLPRSALMDSRIIGPIPIDTIMFYTGE